MEPRAAIHRSGALLLLAAILAAAVTAASAIGDKCAACKAVAVSSSSLRLSLLPLSEHPIKCVLETFYVSEVKKLASIFSARREAVVQDRSWPGSCSVL